MKKTLLSLLFLVIFFTGFSGQWIGINSPVPVPAKIQLVSSDLQRSVVHFTLDGFTLKEVMTPKGPEYVVLVGKSTPIQEGGAPDLPKMTTSLIIPDLAGMDYRIVSSSFTDYEDMAIAPSKGVIMRDTDPNTVPYTFGPSYETDQFYPGALAGTREPYIVRDFRGQTLIAYPFQYNPVTRKLRVYHDLTVELFKSDDNGVNPLVRKSNEIRIHPEFLGVYADQFLNLDATDYTPISDYGKMLVLCYGPFMNAMQPFVYWKNSIGIPTVMINVDSAGSTAAQIKSYIADYYNTNGLTFVLLVGDAPQIPTNQGSGLGGPSDNAYGYIVGNDHYADAFVGRFSAENESQIQTQVQRTLDYESDPTFLSDDWYTTVIGIASNQGPGDDNEYDYQHIRNQQTKLLDYTYTWNPELFDGSQGGNDATGNPSPSLVSAAVNDGSSLILYTGHGSTTSWGTSGFNNNNVNALTNQGKLPFIWSVACVNGDFIGGTCFAEAWLRASKNGEPTGAIAFLGATINQSWNSPMAGQDEMTDILVETYPNNIKRTFAGLSINGCMKMIDQYGGDGKNMADTWTVFGDPSLYVRTDNPDTLLVTHNPILVEGSATLLVSCNKDGARVTATVNDSILATEIVTDNTCTLIFPAPLVSGDTVHLVVTAYNSIPYQSFIPVVLPVPVTVSFAGDPTDIIKGDTVHFTDSSTGGVFTWSWSFPGGNPSVSNEQNPVVVYDAAGYYDVQLIAGNWTNSDTLLVSEYIHVGFPASTGEKTETLNCSVSPNPNHGIFTINISSAMQDSFSIQIYNMVGTCVYQDINIPLNGNVNRQIRLSDLPQGIYFLKIKGNETTVTQKVIIQK